MNSEELKLLEKIDDLPKELNIEIRGIILAEVMLREENKELKKRLEYLRNGEYINQLRYERNMLQDVVDDMKVASEDKAFIDMTYRNTELLEQQQEFIKWLEDEIQNQKNYGASFGLTIEHDIAEYISEKIEIYQEVLSRYKEITGGDNK